MHVTDVLIKRKDSSDTAQTTKLVAHSDARNLSLREILEYVDADVNIFESSDEKIKYSLGYHAGDLGKSRGDDYWGQGYGRGTGHFGFGTYFVGNQEQLGYGGYGERPLESVEFDNYNLFKPKDFEKGLALHDALKVLDGYAQDYSEFAKHSDFS